MALRYRIQLPGPFYYSGRVGPKHWLPRSSNTGTGPMGFVVKWFIIYPSVVIFGAGNMRHAAPKHTNIAPPRPLRRSREIILAAVIYLTASCFAAVGTLGFVAAIWVLWGTLGVR